MSAGADSTSEAGATGKSWGPWHRVGEYYSIPTYWEPEIQSEISTDRRRAIIDCTLSEGEDMVGAHLSWTTRLEIAKRLDELGVDEITTPIGVEMRELRDWIASCRRAGIKAKICDKLVSVVLPLEGNDDWKPRIDQRIACEPDSLVLFAYYPQISYWSDFAEGPFTLQQVIDASQRIVEYAAGRGVEIVYSFPDSFRHRLDSITALSKAGVDAGADGVYIYDSRGQSTPRSSFVICREIKKAIGDKLLYVQHHNDLGMATACSLAAAEAGADVLDASICGVGDRSGTAALEEVAAVLYAYGFETGIKLDQLVPLARYVEWAFGFECQATKPIVGWQANMEEGWGHRDPDDPVESPMAIAGEVLGTPFESVIGPNVFGKIKITQAPGVHKHKDILPDFMDELGIEYGDDDLAEIERRTLDALVARREGYIRIDEFEQIVRGVLDNLPVASG